MQIVLDECISVIAKLTVPQLDTLTVIFLFKYFVSLAIKNRLSSVYF